MSETGNRRPKCNECGTSMNRLFIREGNGRRYLGYYCKFCKVVYFNNGVKARKGPVYIGLKQVI